MAATPRRPLVAGNWKMNGLLPSIEELQKIARGAGTVPKADLMICPPATLLGFCVDAVEGTRIAIGGQDCHAKASGAFTGDIAAEMLANIGAKAVIVGHSERRTYHKETDADVRAKAMTISGFTSSRDMSFSTKALYSAGNSVSPSVRAAPSSP